MRHKLILTLTIVAVLLLLAFCTPMGYGQPPKTLHWDARTQLRLAQCFIAESDEQTDDWTEIAFTLSNWLDVRQRVWPQLRLIDVINTSCSVHKLMAKHRTPRQRWIRQLEFPLAPAAEDGAWVYNKPADFPRASSWERKQRYWHKALAHADRWWHGELRSQCRGKAVIWGAPRDPNNHWHLKTDDPILKKRRVVRLPCSDDLSNDYYRLMTRSEREAQQERLEG